MLSWKHFFAILVPLVFIGCSGGKAEPKTVAVKGKVTLDAKPLATGKITFEGTDGTPPTVLDIKDGAYEGKCSIGSKKVRITSYIMVAPPKTGMTGPEYEKQAEENIIPARFNTDSKEVREVKDGPNEFDFGVMAK